MASPADAPSSSGDVLSKSAVSLNGNLDVSNRDESTEIPLETSWTLWLDKTVRGCSPSEYQSSLQKIYTFKTIQGFWAVYNNIPDVNDIQIRCSYHLMRYERRPIWEEPYNQNGGAWRFRCEKRDTSKVWNELLLTAIGEQFSDVLDQNDDICGLTASVKEKFDVIQLWNSDYNTGRKNDMIDYVLKLLPDVKFVEPFYKPHRTHHAFDSNV